MEDKILKLGAIIIITIILSITSCNIHVDYQIGKAIENGIDPIDAHIAFSSQTTTGHIAIARLGEKNK